MFDDYFTLVQPADVVMNESGIAWRSDMEFLFRNPSDWSNYRTLVRDYEFLYQSYNYTK
jgi:hypothetical protein